jgi:predicted DNA-binding protein (MmcQ/YjbR family)
MTPAALRRRCLALPGATEEFPFDAENSVFKVAGKIFAISRLDGRPLRVSVKCDPGLAEQLRAGYPAITPGYHLNKRHWNTIVLDGSVPDAMVRDMIRTATTSSCPRCRGPRARRWAGPEASPSWPRRRPICRRTASAGSPRSRRR